MGDELTPEDVTTPVEGGGALVLPGSLWQEYNLQPGEELRLLYLSGVFVLMPGHSELDMLSNQIRMALDKRGETLESMLVSLREERERSASQE